ncbi:MAG: hypothetical protein R3296_05150 [Oleiphilaceae bacterium]|nr:hypothetical protein [Oleiphilaceae bacterium]
MITYWAFTGGFPLFLWIFGVPLMGFFAAFYIPAWLGILDSNGPMWSITVAIILQDLIAGAILVSLKAKGKSPAAILSFWAFSAVLAVALVAIPAADIDLRAGLKSLINPKVPLVTSEYSWRRLENPELTSASVLRGYVIENLPGYIKAAKSGTPEDESTESYYARHLSRFDALKAEIVDNDLRITGLSPEHEVYWVAVEARVKVAPEDIPYHEGKNSIGDSKEIWNTDRSDVFRIHFSELVTVSDSDLKKGYVDMPLNGDRVSRLSLHTAVFEEDESNEARLLRSMGRWVAENQ